MPGRTWNSGLSVAEFACLRTTGFEPVGQVMGASVYRVRPWTPIDSKNRYWSPRFFAGGEWGIYNARRKAMNRLVAECRALGGDGIIAVQVEIGPFQGQEHTLAFRVRGTAVRAHGRVRPLRPFSSDLSAQEFAKLIEAGWVPVELVLGVSINQLYDFPGVKRQTLPFADNQEVRWWTDTVGVTRHEARSALREEATRAGADGVVVCRCDLKVHESHGGRFVEARFLGTAVAAFGVARPPEEPPMTRLERLLPALRPSPAPAPPPRPPTIPTSPVIRMSTGEPGSR